MTAAGEQATGIRLGIEASNIRRGGGITHLREMLKAASPQEFGFEEVIVWSGSRTLAELPSDRTWLTLRGHRWLDGSIVKRVLWQNLILPREARRCDVLLVPGGSYLGGVRPFVAMAQNFLPFDARERQRYGLSAMRAKLHALNLVQSATFRCADGMIFMTESSRRAILSVVGPIHAKDITIPHGVEERFVTAERRRRPAEASGPFRFLYLSIIDQYKHQDKVAEAAALLRDEGLNVSVDFVGPAYPPAAKKLEAVRRRVDPTGIFLRYNGPVAYDAVDDVYAGYDAFVFASSCETISSILIEAMASGLPIACSDRMPLPEVLAEAGVYFDPEDTLSIARAMKLLVEDRALRARLSEKAQERAKTFTWRRCAEATFAFLAEIATEHKRGAAQSRC